MRKPGSGRSSHSFNIERSASDTSISQPPTEDIRVTEALLDRGFSPEEATKILGGNFMRVFDSVWKA